MAQKLEEIINEIIEENKKKLLENIYNGNGYNKFLELVKNQGGDIEYIKDTEKFKKSKYIEPVYAERSGYVEKINAEKVGNLVCFLGAGRINKSDIIDNTVGIVLRKKVSEKIEKGEILGYIYSNDFDKAEYAKRNLLDIYKIETSYEKCIKRNSILKIIE